MTIVVKKRIKKMQGDEKTMKLLRRGRERGEIGKSKDESQSCASGILGLAVLAPKRPRNNDGAKVGPGKIYTQSL